MKICDGVHKSFLECLVQACESMGWRVHAWCLLGNHYHLCLQTPEPNLVEGMRWLQSIRQLPDQSFQSF
jgi:REP element-mobilizing transposase RayT